MRYSLLFTALLFYVPYAFGHTINDWHTLLNQGKIDELQTICPEAIKSPDKIAVVKGYNCLANLALIGKDIIVVEKNEVSGGQIRSGYRPEDVDKAMGYLNKSIEIAPEFLTTFQSRMYLTLQSGRYDAAADVLKDSLEKYKGRDAYNAWLAYCTYFFESGQYSSGIKYLKVLDGKYPNHQEIIANLGAFYASLKQDDLALPYMKRAVELAPNDALNNWNLGREYQYIGDNKHADEFYRLAFSLRNNPNNDPLPNGATCIYQQFLQENMHDHLAACKVQATGCQTPKIDCAQ